MTMCKEDSPGGMPSCPSVRLACSLVNWRPLKMMRAVGMRAPSERGSLEIRAERSSNRVVEEGRESSCRVVSPGKSRQRRVVVMANEWRPTPLGGYK
jgi:hypothetical protein